MQFAHDKVNIAGLNIRMRPALIHAEVIAKRHGQELIITCGMEGCHSAGSLHYYGYAFDMRSRFWGKEEIQEVAQEIRTALGKDYDVVVESDHIHIEYDPQWGFIE